ncbi:MAG: cyclic nucleotide-binding domain-containing protein [Chloroflexi bacterium]|nr:cyclic nucleotide-binding domain-containing protein [Chloroflexota bacterium]
MINIEKTIGFLQKVPLFQGLKKRQLELLAKRFVEREYASGQEIVTQGQGGEGFFIIISGKAEALRQRSDGTHVVVNTFGPTDFFGELALLDDGLRTATVAAAEQTRCLVLTRWDFLGELQQDVDMSIAILQELAKRFRFALDTL